MEMLQFLLPPLLACFILVGIHAYLGIHVLEREVIFVDLSLAQMAALGGISALVAGITQPLLLYGISLGFTFLGALLFSFVQAKRWSVPQEAMIGIVYVVSAALAVLVMNASPEEAYHLKDMLVGNILTVSWEQLGEMFLLYAGVGLIHFLWRHRFFRASRQPGEWKFWDFIFYVSFGVVVTSSVAVAGVLLVFTFLIVPAVGAMLFCRRIGERLLFGWGMGFLSSALGLLLSYWLDLPSGAAIVCTFGGVLILLAIGKMAKEYFSGV